MICCKYKRRIIQVLLDSCFIAALCSSRLHPLFSFAATIAFFYSPHRCYLCLSLSIPSLHPSLHPPLLPLLYTVQPSHSFVLFVHQSYCLPSFSTFVFHLPRSCPTCSVSASFSQHSHCPSLKSILLSPCFPLLHLFRLLSFKVLKCT